MNPTVRLGSLLPGAIVIGQGINAARRGFARTDDGKDQPVIVKVATSDELAAEIFCAVLGRTIGLPVPEPIVVKEWASEELLFGSADAEYPNLMQSFHLPKEVTEGQINLVAKRLSGWPLIWQTISFDEWIWNVDRNLGNILWDGDDQFALIDHGRSMGMGVEREGDQNKLLSVMSSPVKTDQVGLQRIKKRVMDTCVAYDKEIADEAALVLRNTPVTPSNANWNRFLIFVSVRLPQLAGLVAKRFPLPQLTLNLN